MRGCNKAPKTRQAVITWHADYGEAKVPERQNDTCRRRDVFQGHCTVEGAGGF